MRVVPAGFGSRGDVEPLIALAVALRELGADVRVCVPPDEEFVARLEAFGVPLVPFGQSVRDLVTSARPDPATVESPSVALETAPAPQTRVRAVAVAKEIRADGALAAVRFLLG